MVQFNDASKQFWQYLVGRHAGVQEVKSDDELRDLAELTGIAGDIVWPGSFQVANAEYATDSSFAAIQNALDRAAISGKKATASGTLTTDQTLIIGADCDLSQLSITYTGTGVAVQVGSSSLGHLHRKKIALPRVTCGTKPAGAFWSAGTVGVKIVNTFRALIEVPLIKNFETGLLLYGDGSYGLGGTSYCTFFITSLENNFVNQKHDYTAAGIVSPSAPEGGWVTQCTFIGGSWSHADGTYPMVGMRHILLGNGSNHVWINASIEGGREEYVIESNGSECLWLNCRYEFSGSGTPPMRWGPISNRNILIGGYQVGQAVHTIDTGGQPPQVIAGNLARLAFTDPGGLTLSSAGGATNLLSVMQTNWQQSGLSPSTAYIIGLTGSAIKLKAPTDATNSPRWSADYSTRRMILGAGTSTAASAIAWGNNSPETVVTAQPGSDYFNYGQPGAGGFGRYIKGSGSAATGWQALGFQPFTTAARPTPATAGIGGTYFDTTLNKPGWSDGTNWRDAAGTII